MNLKSANMKIIRYLAGALMVISGVWHGVLGFQTVENRPMLVFAIAYLIIGIFLLLKKNRVVYFIALILPITGLLAASIKIGWSNFDFSLYALVLIDFIVIVISTILMINTYHKTAIA